jgi:hypothetical protein
VFCRLRSELNIIDASNLEWELHWCMQGMSLLD